MLERRLAEADVTMRGFVLDGFPRTVDQAQILDGILAPGSLDVVVELLVSETEAAQRLEARLVCPHCARVIRSERRSGLCEHCGEMLARRSDDDREIVLRRFEAFNAETIPLIEGLDRGGRLITVDGHQPVAEVTRQILAELRRTVPARFG
jgi:adenylate kinase